MLATSAGLGSQAAETGTGESPGSVASSVSAELKTSPQYNEQILNKVDKLVRENLYSKSLVTTAWEPALERERKAILASKNLVELADSINRTLGSIHSSHCEFVTINDETYYFLHGLFVRREKLKTPVYVGFMTGPPRFATDQVRYVLNDSPASKAGIQVGDRILTVNGHRYVGQVDFINHLSEPDEDEVEQNRNGTVRPRYVGRSLSRKHAVTPTPVTIELERDGKNIAVKLTPLKKDVYLAYVQATEKSARTYKVGGFTLGYVHHWCGGRNGHEALEEVLGEKLGGTDGLILDLRDGYGGNGLDDLDYFYRPPAAYPSFVSKTRDGKMSADKEFYDKPVVALINDGSRSGKELLAFSLKRTGRAKLVGMNTAGAFLGGRFLVIDDKTALYLPVIDCTVGGVRLEGVGVAPDVPIDDRTSESGKREQLDKAQALLIETLDAGKTPAPSSP
jgi:carboxyl-terminal processing protease